MWETALREAFGEHFINMRTFMIEQGLETAGLEPTEQDLDDLENGRVPEQLRTIIRILIHMDIMQWVQLYTIRAWN